MIKQYFNYLKNSNKTERATDWEFACVLFPVIFFVYGVSIFVIAIGKCFVLFDFSLYNWFAVVRFAMLMSIPMLIHFLWWKNAKTK